MPVSRFDSEALSSIIGEMDQIVEVLADINAEHGFNDVYHFNEFNNINDLRIPDIIPTHTTPVLEADELIQPKFEGLWKSHTPVIVTGVSPPEKNRWTPQYIAQQYGDQLCPIENCETGEQKIASVRDFFNMYGKGVREPWKLKVSGVYHSRPFHYKWL